MPYRVLARVMDIGTWEDIVLMLRTVDAEILRRTLAEAGWFRPRSWHFWHYRLGLAAEIEDIPPMPKRSSK